MSRTSWSSASGLTIRTRARITCRYTCQVLRKFSRRCKTAAQTVFFSLRTCAASPSARESWRMTRSSLRKRTRKTRGGTFWKLSSAKPQGWRPERAFPCAIASENGKSFMRTAWTSMTFCPISSTIRPGICTGCSRSL